MTDNLRDRIAAALYRHAGESVPNEVPWLSWGETFPVVREVWLSMADAVIRELQLHVVTVGHFQTVIKGSYPTPLEENDD